MRLETWEEDFDFLLQFAGKTKCKSLVFDTSNNNIQRIAEQIGFKETTRSYEYMI